MIGHNVRRAFCTIYQKSALLTQISAGSTKTLHHQQNKFLSNVNNKIRLISTTVHRQLCSDDQYEKGGTKESRTEPLKTNLKPPKPPPEGLCCGSGCAKCVWFVYAEELMEHYQDGGTAAMKSLDQVPDPNIREFLKMELKMRIKKKIELNSY